MRARQGQGKNIILTGHTIGSIKRNVLESLTEMFGIDCKPDNHGRFSLFGNNINCFGADKQDSYKNMTGMTGAGWYANEISLHHANSVQEAFNRCSDENAFFLWDTNPDYPEHPIKTRFIDHSGEKLSTGKPWIQSWHFTIEDNPALSAEYVENLKRSTAPGMWYDRAIKGLWVMAEGLVFETFDRNRHVIDSFGIPDHWKRVRGIDYGHTNPFVCLWGALDEDDRLYIYDEHYRKKMLVRDHAEIIKQRGGTYIWTVADWDAEGNAQMQKAGIYTRNAQKDIATGLENVAKRLVIQPDDQPRVFITSNCKNLIREFGLYRWNEPKDGRNEKEEPVKEHDHAMDTLRYMVMEVDNKGFIYV